MLDFVIFAFSAVVGLVVLLIFYLLQRQTSPPPSKGTFVPGWDRKPADEEAGDLKELSKHGSIHQYLVHIHKGGKQPIAVFWWRKQRMVSICSPELFKDTIKLTNRPKVLFSFLEPMIGSQNIQYSNGLDWEERRKVLYPILRDKFLEGYIPCFIKIADETAALWSQLPPNSSIELQQEFFTMTIKGITRTCFGDTFNTNEEIRKMTESDSKVWEEMEQSLHIGPPDPGSNREREFNENLKNMKDTVLKVVNNRRDGVDTNEIPFIDALLQTQAPDEQICSDSMSFMVGGLHTSALLLVWVIHYMSLYPDIAARLIKEMGEEVGDDRDQKLKDYVYSTNSYLRQVLDESLRMSTLAPYSGRFSETDIVVGGYLIPKETPIVNALGVALKNETIWKDPHIFDPSHCAVGALKGKDTLVFSPFGMGRRKCPGYLFSYVEVGTFLTILLQQFKFEPVGGAKEVEQVYGLVTNPKDKLYYYVHLI